MTKAVASTCPLPLTPLGRPMASDRKHLKAACRRVRQRRLSPRNGRSLARPRTGLSSWPSSCTPEAEVNAPADVGGLHAARGAYVAGIAIPGAAA
jgi:hypothetical protein